MKSIWVPISGAIAQQKKVETIANNIANANTPGFKEDNIVFKEELAVLQKGNEDGDLPINEWSPKDFYNHQGAEDAYVKVDGTYTSFKQGQLRPTNNPLDVAISGKGFFEIKTVNGLRYSRQGNFSINADGELITNNGNHVLSQFDIKKDLKDLNDPEKRIIKLPPGKIVVNNNGEIYSNGNLVAKMSVVEFADIQSLKKEGNSMFINQDTNNIKREDINSKTHQGFIEESNINVIGQMAELIKANRHFETIQRAIKAYDTISGKGVNEISNF